MCQGVSHDREGYALAAGQALGLITLGRGRKAVGLADLHLEERLMSVAGWLAGWLTRCRLLVEFSAGLAGWLGVGVVVWPSQRACLLGPNKMLSDRLVRQTGAGGT